MEGAPVFRKKKQLEIFLQKVPNFQKPVASLEQYKTPATIASDIVFNAFSTGDIFEKNIVDLGCGTGIFAIAASVMGAKQVVGVDIDVGAVEVGRAFAAEHGLDAEFEVMDTGEYSSKCDTVLQNPPFGAQKKRADRVFIETAAKIAGVVYSIHNSNTAPFVRLIADKLGFDVAFEKNYIFKLEHTFDFHKKPRVDHEVTLFRLVKRI